jgi:hypothetical protein
MKITKNQLRRIIKEERAKLLKEVGLPKDAWAEYAPMPDEEIRDELLPIVLQLKGKHGEDAVAAGLESFASQLKRGFI